MKTRIKNFSGGEFTFEYSEARRPLPRDWHHVNGDAAPMTWRTAAERDRARACFTHRRSVAAALADLKRAGLQP